MAGFRILNLLFSGRTLYIDDLVTRDSDRSRGFGAALFDWLVEHAKEQGCEHLTLDSGVQRFAAHRFYLNRGMDITSHHFELEADLVVAVTVIADAECTNDEQRYRESTNDECTNVEGSLECTK